MAILFPSAARGTRVAKKLSGTTGRLTTVFAALIFVVAAYMLFRTVSVMI